MGVFSLHDLGKLDLEVLDGSDGGETVVSSKSVNVEFWTSAQLQCMVKIDIPPSAMWAISSSSR
jgi:hypothetical protein